MHEHLSYPKSFPNTDEITFLTMILADDASFPQLWQIWKSSHAFDELIDPQVHLLPLVYLRMRDLQLHDDTWFGKIKGVYKNAWVKNQRLLAVTKDVISTCDAQNIPSLFLKGIPLIYDVYADIGARFLGDADFLIPPAHAVTMTNLMLEHGWHYHKPWMIDAKNPCNSIFQVIKATTFSNDFGVDMDIHWNLFALTHHTRLRDIFLLKPVSSIRYRDIFWKDFVLLDMDTIRTKRLSNEDLLIHIIIHGSEGNNYRTIRWVTDAISTIRKLSIDWETIIDRARTFHFSLELFLALRFLSEHFPKIIPDNVLLSLSEIPITKREIANYYRFTNITHTKRFSAFGNFPLIWYGYWKYESKKSLSGFFTYLKKSFGLRTTKELFKFIINKYRARFLFIMRKIFMKQFP
jgi:hypothetical protein